MQDSRQKYFNYSLSFLVVLCVLLALAFVLLKDREPAGQQVKTKFKQGKVVASNSWYLESPFILDEIIADDLQRDLFKSFSDKVSGLGEYNFRFLAAKDTEILVEAQVKNPARTPRIWLYDAESKMVQKPQLSKDAGKLIYKFKINEEDFYKLKVYFDYSNLLSLQLIAKVKEKEDPSQLRKAYMQRAIKTLEINISKQQEKALKELTQKQFEIFKHYKVNPLPSDIATRPLKKTGGRVLVKVRTPGDTWSVASLGIAGRTFEHQDLNKLFGSVDIKILSGSLPLNMKRFKLYTLQAKSFTRDFLFEQSLKDIGLLLPRQDLVKVIVNGELYGFMELLEDSSSHFFEYAQKIDGTIYGFNAGEINDHLRNPKLIEEFNGKSGTKKKYNLSLASYQFADKLCKPNMDLFSSFVYAYAGLHGAAQGDLTFHHNERMDCISVIPRDITSGLYSPFFAEDPRQQRASFAEALAYFDWIAPQWRPLVVGRAESFLLKANVSSQADFSFHWFAHSPASLYYYLKEDNFKDLIESSKYWAGLVSRNNLKRRVENLSYSLGEVAAQLSPDQKQMPRVVAYHLNNAIRLIKDHPKNLIEAEALQGDINLKKIIETLSSGQILVSDWDLKSLATRNQMIEALNLAADGLDLSQLNSVINFLYRQELDDELRIIFVERGPNFEDGSFELKERGGEHETIKPSVVMDFGSTVYPIDKKKLALAQINRDEKLRAYYFKIPKTDVYRYFGYELTGNKQIWASREFAVSSQSQNEEQNYVKEELEKFFNIDSSRLRFKSSQVLIENTIEIPRNYKLLVDKDQQLRFAANGCLMVYGSVQVAPEAHLDLAPELDTWSGLHFVANEDLSLRNIRVSSIGDGSYGVKCGGRNFSGGVSFFDTKVELENIQVLNSHVEDAMHFLRSEFVMTKSLVSGAQSDAIDADFSNLQINNSKLENSKGDGLDVSGSFVLLKEFESINQTDKGLSVGENSNVFVFESSFSSKDYCIAIKDSSRLYLDSATQLLACKTPIGEYIKKPYFTKPELVRLP